VNQLPDAAGHFGPFGGRFVPEALIAALDELAVAHREALADPVFTGELTRLLTTYAGRPTPITEARRFSEHAGGARILLKREDLTHTGSHKINNVLGQALPARASTVSPPPPRPRCSGSTARSTWARKTPSARR
jgi:tryptophan synthase beta chain